MRWAAPPAVIPFTTIENMPLPLTCASRKASSAGEPGRWTLLPIEMGTLLSWPTWMFLAAVGRRARGAKRELTGEAGGHVHGADRRHRDIGRIERQVLHGRLVILDLLDG